MLSIQLETTLTLSPKKKKEKEFTGPKNPTCVERAPDIAIPTARGTGPKFAGSRDVVVCCCCCCFGIYVRAFMERHGL